MDNYMLRLTDAQIRVIVAGLQEMPYKLSAPVIQELHTQVSAAEAAAAEHAPQSRPSAGIPPANPKK